MAIGTLQLFGIHSKVGYARHFVKLAKDLFALLKDSEYMHYLSLDYLSDSGQII